MLRNGKRFLAIGCRLKGVSEVLTLGVRPNFFDYTPDERMMILQSDPILFPTINYAQYLTTIGKRIFPSLETHLYADDKIKQTTLFQMLGIPHPRTRAYYRRHRNHITADFHFPFIAKIPRNSGCGRGVFLIKDEAGLAEYLARTEVAYVQEYLPHKRDLRVVLINYDPIAAYWRRVPEGDFRANLTRGGSIDFKDVPEEAVALARDTALTCRFDDVGLDLIESEGRWFVIEANMMYGRRGLEAMKMDLKDIIRQKLLRGDIGG
jgi:ribosomal protein S6--L-glutamate ligase